jgi:hypothetical protein
MKLISQIIIEKFDIINILYHNILVRKILNYFLQYLIVLIGLIFIVIASAIIMISAKPRKFLPLNNYISKILKSDFNDATIFFSNGLIYSVPKNNIELANMKIEFDGFTLRFEILQFLVGKISIKDLRLSNIYIETTNKDNKDNRDNNKNKLELLSYLRFFKTNSFVLENININNKIKFDRIDIDLNNDIVFLSINKGNFFLKEYFFDNIDFRHLEAILKIKDNEYLDAESISLNIDNMNLDISLLNKEKSERELYISIKNIDFKSLNKYWPHTLGKGIARPWVLKHISDGVSPFAWAKMLFVDNKLIEIDAEVQMKDIILNYNNYFPQITNINGIATFTKKNMVINIDNAKTLNSDINNSIVKMDFTKKNNLTLDIYGNTSGKLYDIFTHIDKNNKNSIINKVNNVIEDIITTTKFEIIVPLDNTDFKKTKIITESTIKNKQNILLSGNNEVFLTFNKKHNSNSFNGVIDLTKNSISFFNLKKNINEPLLIKYNLTISKDGNFKINEIKAENNIKFIANGDLKNIFVKDMEYDNSIFDIHITPLSIAITGKQLDISNIDIMDTIINMQKNNENNENNENKIPLIAQFDNVIIKNGKGLKNLVLNLNKMLNLKSNLLEITDSYLFSTTNLGDLLENFSITDKIIGGNVDIEFKKGKYSEGNFRIKNQIILITDEKQTKKNVTDRLLDTSHKKDFFFDNFVTNTEVILDSVEGDFDIKKDILNIKKVKGKNTSYDISLVAKGNINLKTMNTDISGIIIPMNTFNKLLNIKSKIPLISKFFSDGNENGIITYKFLITRKNKDSKHNVKVKKETATFSTLLDMSFYLLFIFI